MLSGEIIREDKSEPHILNYSRDAQFGVVKLNNRYVEIWDLEKKAPISTLGKKFLNIEGALFTRDNKRVVTFGDDVSAQLWDIHSGKLLLTFNGHSGFVSTARLAPGDAHLITSSNGIIKKMERLENGEEFRYESRGDNTIRIWDMRTGQQLEILPMDKFGGNIYVPIGRRILHCGPHPDPSGVTLIVRKRSDGIWGVAWLPEFWLTLVLGVGLVVSVWRDFRILRHP